jgi:hypothetical protein
MDLPRSREALARAERMLDELVGYALESVAFRDRIPYVLDLLDGVTRTIHSESRGHRSPEFVAWWSTVDRSAQQSIHEMRNAELKDFEPRTAAHYEVFIGEPPADYPDLPAINNGDSVTRVRWEFHEGTLHTKPVLETLRDYLRHAGELVEAAERKLAP